MYKLKYFLKKSLRLRFFRKAIKALFNAKEMRRFMNLDPTILKVDNYGGSAKPNKFIYWIRQDDTGNGFFALFNRTLRYLAYANHFHLEPIVQYGKHGLNYDSSVKRTHNPFEYYFLQTSQNKVENVMENKHVIVSRHVDSQLLFPSTSKATEYLISEEEIEHLGSIYKKYISLNNETMSYINGLFLETVNSNSVLGVHARGTDFKKYNFKHPKFIPEEDYFKEIDILMEKLKYDYIFLATDDSAILSKFRIKYRDILIYYENNFRADQKINLAAIPNSSNGHKFKSGLEVFIDAFTLSKCNGLIAGLSQVSIAARIMKASTDQKYSDLIILNRGFHN